MSPSGIELAIFGCDGVLVDTERLHVRTEAARLSELGWPLTEDEEVARFVGRSTAYMHAKSNATSGVAAGVAAGMSVVAFAGGVTPAHRLAGDGVVVIGDMRQLPGILGFNH